MAQPLRSQSQAELEQQVVEKMISLRRELVVRDRWFWTGWAVQVYRGLTILGLVGGLFAAIMGMLGNAPRAAGMSPSQVVASALLGVVGSAVSIFVATLAIRYCDARANGRLDR